MSCFCLRLQKDVVKTLDFRHCGLNFVPDEIYEYDETLQELFLDSNNIKDLPRSLFHCEFLRILSVCDNDLCVVPSAVATLVNLEQLDISKNGIVELPDSIKSCKNLSMVEISVNPLGKLPEGFTQLVNLTQLYLNDTLLNYLPANFGRLVKLTVLELRENRLKALPRSMARLTELERLDLGMNEFRKLPEVIGFFTKLTELWLDSNKLTSIPSEIGNLKELVYFDASCNRIEHLPAEIEGLDSLTDLHLSKNYLQDLPKAIGRLSNLQNLKLDCNQISCLPYSIGGLVSLEELILTYNDLEELPPSIGLLRKLTHLNADQNMLLELPPELGSCSAISLLSLHSNLLMSLPDEIGHISSLSVVNLSNNQLQCLPYKITKLKKLQALWLSENQCKPLIPLQSEMRRDLGRRVLTCFLFPQKHRDPEELDAYQSDGESFHTSQWEEQRLSRRQIAFDVSESDSERNLKRPPTPYPKERVKKKSLAKSQGASTKLGRPSRGQKGNILPNYPSVDTSSRHGTPGSPRDGKSRRPRSPGSPIADSLHLFQADKEKMAKDKARLRGSISSVSRHDSDTESVASSTRERVMGRREIRARMDRAAMSDTEAFIQSPVWSHMDRANGRPETLTLSQTLSTPQSQGRSSQQASSQGRSSQRANGRGYESDRAGSSQFVGGRSPKVPQMQVGGPSSSARAPCGASDGGRSVGRSRGYESDHVDAARSPWGAVAVRRRPAEGNRNANAASNGNADEDGRRSHRRSSGYSTDPGRGSSSQAELRQRRDEMLPPPYYRVRQLRAGAQPRAQADRGTPRRHPAKFRPQSFKDYGWIDTQLPATPEGQDAAVTADGANPEAPGSDNAEAVSASHVADKGDAPDSDRTQTPTVVSSRRHPASSRKPDRTHGDLSAYSDTELASSLRRNRQRPVKATPAEFGSREADWALDRTHEHGRPVSEDNRSERPDQDSGPRHSRTVPEGHQANATDQLQPRDAHTERGSEKQRGPDGRQGSYPGYDAGNQTQRGNTRQPAGDYQLRRLSNGDNTRQPASDYRQRQSSNGDNTRQPAGDYQQRQSSNGDNTRQPAGDYQQRQSSNGDNTRQPAGDYQQRQSSNGDNTRQPASDYQQRQSSNGDNTKQPAGDYQQRQSSNGDNTRQPAGDYHQRRSSNGDNTRQPAGDYQQRQSSNGDNTRQPAGDYQQRQSSNGDNTRQPASDYQQRQSSNGNNTDRRDYLRSLEGRQRQVASHPAQSQRRPNDQGTRSLPRDIHPPRPDQWEAEHGSEKSASLPRSDTRVEADKGIPVRTRYGTARGPDRKSRLHGGAPNYAASQPELRSDPSSSAREPYGRESGGPPPDFDRSVAGDRMRRRRSRSPISEQEMAMTKAAGRFPLGLASSTPSMNASGSGGPGGPSAYGPDKIREDAAPSSGPPPLPPPRSQSDGESLHKPRVSEDVHRPARPNRLPLNGDGRTYGSNSVPGKLSFDRRDSDASVLQQQQQQQQSGQTAHSRPYPPPYHLAGRRDGQRDSLPTPVARDDAVGYRRASGDFTPGLDPRALPGPPQGLSAQSARVPGPDLWPQDSSGYASDPNDQGWKRGSCSTPTSSIQGASSPPMWRPGSDVTPPDPRSRQPAVSSHEDGPPPPLGKKVVIYKNPGLGFSITGGKDAPGNPFKPYDWGIFVTKIQPGGPAEGILKPGDKVLEVNGRRYDNILHDEAVQLLRKTNPVSMVVQQSDR